MKDSKKGGSNVKMKAKSTKGNVNLTGRDYKVTKTTNWSFQIPLFLSLAIGAGALAYNLLPKSVPPGSAESQTQK